MPRLLFQCLFTVSTLILCSTSSLAQTLNGTYQVAEDFEGGKICDIRLTSEVSIGGQGLEADDKCLETIDFGGEPVAWHIDDEGWLRFTDALRKLIIRFEPQSDGGFYARRVELGKESLSLSRAD